jgi:hypothetical protein
VPWSKGIQDSRGASGSGGHQRAVLARRPAPLAWTLPEMVDPMPLVIQTEQPCSDLDGGALAGKSVPAAKAARSDPSEKERAYPAVGRTWPTREKHFDACPRECEPQGARHQGCPGAFRSRIGSVARWGLGSRTQRHVRRSVGR